MNFYPFHLGDYISRTQHLSHLEDLCYRRMIDRYYLTEEMLPLNHGMIGRLIGMRDHIDIVAMIASEFFTKTPEGYYHSRCAEEIQKYHKKAERARGLADKRWHGQSNDTTSHTKSHTISNTESSATNTNTNTTKSSTKKVADAPVVCPQELATNEFRKAWDEYVSYRKVMKFKSLKLSSIQKLWDELATWGHDAAIQSINNSIRNGWQGIFEPKTGVAAAKPEKPLGKYASMLS